MDWSTNREDEFEINYQGLKLLLENTLKKVSQTNDLRDSKGMLIEVQNAFKGLKLQREQREELYAQVQEAFAEINKKIAKERSDFEEEAQRNYADFRIRIEEAQFLATHPKDFHETWEHLLEIQSDFKGAKFLREHREELYRGLQNAFEILKNKKSAEKNVEFEESSTTFEMLLEKVGDAVKRASSASDIRLFKDEIIGLQTSIRESKLVKEHREELKDKLQEAFTSLNLRQDSDQVAFQKNARVNYERLKILVEEGLVKAEETSKYKETREFLKKIQSEFKGIKLIRDQREELYSRLQTAFGILNKRVDEFFREKKKNWMVKMQYKFSESSGEIFLLQKSLEKDEAYLAELEDQLEIVIMAKKDEEIIAGIRSRIHSTRKSIERKNQEILELETKMEELHDLLEPPEA